MPQQLTTCLFFLQFDLKLKVYFYENKIYEQKKLQSGNMYFFILYFHGGTAISFFCFLASTKLTGNGRVQLPKLSILSTFHIINFVQETMIHVFEKGGVLTQCNALQPSSLQLFLNLTSWYVCW